GGGWPGPLGESTVTCSTQRPSGKQDWDTGPVRVLGVGRGSPVTGSEGGLPPATRSDPTEGPAPPRSGDARRCVLRGDPGTIRMNGLWQPARSLGPVR